MMSRRRGGDGGKRFQIIIVFRRKEVVSEWELECDCRSMLSVARTAFGGWSSTQVGDRSGGAAVRVLCCVVVVNGQSGFFWTGERSNVVIYEGR